MQHQPIDFDFTAGLKFEMVKHVSHFEHSIRIIEDKKIRASLADGPTLGDQRICTVSVTPSSWSEGYRYGSCAWKFDWNWLFCEKKFYWVEASDYGQTLCRILVTEKDYSGCAKLQCYDPKGPGPWKFEGKTYSISNDVFIEFLVECDLDLVDCKALDYVRHHKDQCHIGDVEKCVDLKQLRTEQLNYLFRLCLMRRISLPEHLGRPHFEIKKEEIAGLYRQSLEKFDFTGVEKGDSLFLARAAESALVVNGNFEWQELLERFNDIDSAIEAITQIYTEVLGTS